MDFSKERSGGILVLLADSEVKLFEALVESLGRRGVTTLSVDKVVDVEAEGTDLAAELVGRLGPVLLADVFTNILVDAGLYRMKKVTCQSRIHRVRVSIQTSACARFRYSRARAYAPQTPWRAPRFPSS